MKRLMPSPVLKIVGGVLIGSAVFQIVVGEVNTSDDQLVVPVVRFGTPAIIIWLLWLSDDIARDLLSEESRLVSGLTKVIAYCFSAVIFLVLILLLIFYYEFYITYSLFLGAATLIAADLQNLKSKSGSSE
jgi:hypothetical protein